ncbi:MAG: DUF3450 family protein [Deltaproteobacteria bacterium]|nr:DUF3450 family protein [Deltaproteobacteria bacterium]
MRCFIISSMLALGLLFNFSTWTMAEDLRAMALDVREKKAVVIEKARREAQTAEKEARESQNRILSDKIALKAAVSELKKQNTILDKKIKALEKTRNELATREKNLAAQLEKTNAVIRELSGFVHSNAKDLEALLKQSLQSALAPDRGKFLRAVANQSKFPGMDDIRKMEDLLFEEITKSGEVRVEHGPILNRSGEETTADILVLGNFSAAYRLSNETGFLIYSDTSKRFFALSKLPSSRIAKKIKQYLAGQSEDVPIDISRGGALRQLTHHLSLGEQIKKGGPIVWPILGIGVLALLIIIERLSYLLRMRVNGDGLMQNVCDLALKQDWQGCINICTQLKKKPVSKVLLAGINFRTTSREDMENALQEAILREIPRLEKFLSTLGMLAAIAPLLGLLGTVTGMINTFQVITYFGTGDPRMMSGGISEALVTTMLGLTVAIPIMLCHTLLSRTVENQIGQMEEKSVAFVNIVFKSRNNNK